MSLKISEKEYNKIIKNQTKQNTENKFKNKKIKVDGISFDSTKEYERYCYLKLLEKAKNIKNLRFHQKEDKIILLDDPIITYVPDFCYVENGKNIVEDFKEFQTKEFILKKKMIISKIKKKELDIVFRIVKYNAGNFEIVEEYFYKND